MTPKPKIGRPKGEPKRQTRFMWSVPVADFLEEYRDWVEKNWKLIVTIAKGKK